MPKLLQTRAHMIHTNLAMQLPGILVDQGRRKQTVSGHAGHSTNNEGYCVHTAAQVAVGGGCGRVDARVKHGSFSKIYV